MPLIGDISIVQHTPYPNTTIPNPIMSSVNFRTALIHIMDERDMALIPTEGLTGIELQEAIHSNDGIQQLTDEICKLHERMAIAPKTAAKKTETAADEDKPKPKRTRKSKDPKEETEPAEDKPKRTRKGKEPKEESEPAEDKPKPKPKGVAGNYATFTSRVTQANKGDTTGWADLKVKVSLAKVSAAGQALLDHVAGAKFLALKDTEATMSEILDQAKALLTAADGKVHPFKLSGLLWAAVGNVDPFSA